MTTRTGKVAELTFAAKALALGVEICEPLVDDKGYDFLLLYGNECKRVQVKKAKTAEKRPGYYYTVVDLTSGRKKETYKEGFDLLVAVEDDNIWLIPVENITGSRYVSITDNHEKWL